MSDNPQAFPCLDNSGEGFGLSMRDPGMTLRDWFAGQALAGLSGAFARVSPKGKETPAQADARWSYERADAMLKARNTP